TAPHMPALTAAAAAGRRLGLAEPRQAHRRPARAGTRPEADRETGAVAGDEGTDEILEEIRSVRPRGCPEREAHDADCSEVVADLARAPRLPPARPGPRSPPPADHQHGPGSGGSSTPPPRGESFPQPRAVAHVGPRSQLSRPPLRWQSLERL